MSDRLRTEVTGEARRTGWEDMADTVKFASHDSVKIKIQPDLAWEIQRLPFDRSVGSFTGTKRHAGKKSWRISEWWLVFARFAQIRYHSSHAEL